ncbi:hypothetical protein DEI82_14580 [Curtobacterium sp. MCBD17_019]|nr:hypothetical protein DEI82_14580 [Curtobacterium sp. MCBD17_019]
MRQVGPYDGAMPGLILQQLPPTSAWASPFEPRLPGFNDGWWIRTWRESGRDEADALSFFDSGEEVARAMLLPHAPQAAHVGLGRLVHPMELARFEVAAHRQGQGIGRRAVELMVQDLWVHGDAAGFYERTGWMRYNRADGDRSIVPFFTLHA